MNLSNDLILPDIGSNLSSLDVSPPVFHSPSLSLRDVIRVVLTSVVLGVIIALTICGNALVIAAVATERSLRNFVANYLIASLAAADLLVALLVMPLAAINEVSLFSFPARTRVQSNEISSF